MWKFKWQKNTTDATINHQNFAKLFSAVGLTFYKFTNWRTNFINDKFQKMFIMFMKSNVGKVSNNMMQRGIEKGFECCLEK